MKWLRKDSSHSEQISTAESKPGPEQASVNAANPASEPGTLEQPADETLRESKDDPEILPPEDYRPAAESAPKTMRRRDERPSESDSPESTQARPRRTPFKKTWIGQHWKTFAILMAIFCLALFARAFYGLEPSTEDGFILSGGSDSYYHDYVITHAEDTGHHLFGEPMLNYPLGTRNPRPPLYDWSVSLMGIGLSPFFGGDSYTSTFYAFLFSTAFWGALTIFPVYYLGKEAFGKKTGIISALLLAIMPGHIMRSVLTNADHDAITLFFMVTAFFFFLKALKTMKQRDWISDWTKPMGIFSGMKGFISENKPSILYALLSGLSLAGVALIWQGFAYAIVLIAVYFLFQIVINRFRNMDSFGVTVIYMVSVGTGLLMAFPYYYLSIQIPSWFDTPTYVVLALFAFAMVLMVTRKYPWFLVLSLLLLIGVVSVILLDILAHTLYHSLLNTLLSGGGYFINNKQYQTIAEAQAPSFSNLAMSFGMITFWLSFAGIAWAILQLPKSWKPDFTFILLWSATSIYMAVSAARFMFNASPAFAITAGWVIALIVEKVDLKKYAANLQRSSGFSLSQKYVIIIALALTTLIIASVALSSVSDISYEVFVIGITAIVGVYLLGLISETNPNRIYSFITVLVPVMGAMGYVLAGLYSDIQFTPATHGFVLAVLLFSYLVLYLKVRKISFFFTFGILFLALCVVTPNVWTGLDAGIPYETKKDFDLEIYNSLPVFLHPDDYDSVNGTNWYLGAFGYSLPLNSQYWPAAYDWLATQDTEIYPSSDKPAFISWWDYGFEIVNEGKHPTVADNFLGGHQLAGNFIMSQSEEDAIALLSVRILEGDWFRGIGITNNYFSPEVLALMDSHGIDSARMADIFKNPSDYIDTILENPHIYGPRDGNMQDVNAKYIAARVLITQALDMEGTVRFYNDLCDLTGYSIRYFGIDSRLFPFSADNTGIFYAPAKLSDHRIDDVANQPYDFWEIKAIGEYGGEYSLDDVPPDVNLNQETPYKIVYKDMFYNSMLYKAFIGYSGSDINMDEGIPSLTEALSSNQIMPGWNMTHFKLVHRTAYWNPYSAKDIQNHTDAWKAMNYWEAYKKQQAGEGISDLSDRSSLYQGVMMLKYYDGAIISGKVTMKDGTPLEGISVTVSDDFSIPHQRVITAKDGSYSIIAPFGNITLTASSGSIDALTMVGTTLNTTKIFIEDYQAMRENQDRDSNGQPDYLVSQNLIVTNGSAKGVVYWDIDSDSVNGDNDPKPKNAQVTYISKDYTFEKSTATDSSGFYSFNMLPPGGYTALVTYANRTVGNQTVSVASGQTLNADINLAAIRLTGTVTYSDNSPAVDAMVILKMPEENIEISASCDANGTYIFNNLIEGNYTAQAYTYASASTQTRKTINPNENNTLNFVIYDSILLQGDLRINDLPVPYATIKFAGPSDSIVVTDSEGHYSIVLNAGTYTYYVNHIRNGVSYTDIGQIYLTDDQVLDMSLKVSSLVTGKVKSYTGANSSFTQVIFDTLDQKVLLSSVTDRWGHYSINLPQGTYRIQVSIGTGSYYGVHAFTESQQNVDIQLNAGAQVSGCVYWDISNTGSIDAGEGLSMARVTFRDPSGSYAQAVTNETGNFSVTLPPTMLYDITVTKLGFEPVSLGSFTPMQLAGGIFQPLVPIKIPLSGSVYLDDEVLTDQNIIIHLNSEDARIPSTQVQVGRDGSYSVSVLPGLYTVTFTHNISVDDDSRVYQIQEEFTVDTGYYTGRNIPMDLAAVIRTKVNVTISETSQPGANISFRMGPEDLYFNMDGFSDEFYIRPGSYILSASQALNESFMVGIKETQVGNSTLSVLVPLTEGLELTGKVTHNGSSVINQKITFKDTASNVTLSVYTDNQGIYYVILIPKHEYEVTVNFTGYDEVPYLRGYRYFYGPKFLIASVGLSSYNIALNRANYSVMTNGTVFIDGLPAPGTTLTFYSDIANFTVESNSTGFFELSIVPSEYVLYAHHPSTHSVYLGKALIDIEDNNMEVHLQRGLRFYGTAYYDLSKNTRTSLIFTDDEDLSFPYMTDEMGYFNIWLPSGDYRLASDLVIQKNEMDIRYTLDTVVGLYDEKQFNLPLSMVEERIVFISYNPTQLTETKGNVTNIYTFEVENTGNIRDTYSLSATGGNPDWIIDLSQYQISLEPGVKTRVSVTVTIPSNPRIDQNQLTLNAVSQKNSTVRHSQVMSIPLHQTHSFGIDPIALSPTFSGGKISSQFKITNEGNGADKFTIYIANSEDLAAYGWMAEIGAPSGATVMPDGKTVVNVSAAYGSSVNIPLSVKPIGEQTSRQATVLVVAYSQNDQNVISSGYVVLKYPEIQISPPSLNVTGVDVAQDAGNQLTNAGVMVVSVAATLLLFYYARKKRWIR